MKQTNKDTERVSRVLVTGADGFIGKNLVVRLGETVNCTVHTFVRETDIQRLPALISDTDFVVHLAGENRPSDHTAFKKVNTDLTKTLCDALITEHQKTGRKVSLILASSAQAAQDNPYGHSKAEAEIISLNYSKTTGAQTYIYRLPNVFGKWCKPNYNSVIATFCHNIANKLPITISNKHAELSLVYIDDVCNSFISLIKNASGVGFKTVSPVYHTTVGEIAKLLHKFDESRTTLISEEVGVGLVRALYSTYVSYLKPLQFSYRIPGYSDARGSFVEVLKTQSSGQVSFFTAYPGVIRGGHYHHSKTEKFLTVKGKSKYRFKNIITDEAHEIITSETEHQIIETVPGWTHDIQNVGDEEMVVMVWANEIFDKENPDTVLCPIS